jgi:methane monooxygenase component C
VVDILRRDLQGTGVSPDLYLCGPPGMVDAVYAVCAEAGIAQNKIFLEKFLPSVS